MGFIILIDTMATTIYVLKLEGGRYYVGKTEHLMRRYQEHMRGEGAAWTSKYKPLSLVQKIENAGPFDEDMVVKEYMAKHGIDMVRGGSYVTDVLSEAEKQMIQKELWSAHDKCTQCGSSSHWSAKCTGKKIVHFEEPEKEPAYQPSNAVAARMASIKEEKRLQEAAEIEALEKAKVEWEAEILLGIEAGKLPSREILDLSIESWPEHDIQENIKRCMEAGCNHEERVAVKTMKIPQGKLGYKRYMKFLHNNAARPSSILPQFYSTIVANSTVMQDTLDIAKAIDYVQMGLVPEVIDAYPWKITAITPLIKERAKFRIDLLRHLYPSLQRI